MKIAGIDSMVLIYAGIVPKKPESEEASQPQEDRTVRAKLLLHILRNETIVLPTIAVAELLVPVPSHQKGTLAAILAKKFLCASFDLKAAAIAAELWSQHKSLPQDMQYKNRSVLKSDVMIIGAAKSAGATEFYSHDSRCRNLANRIMHAHDLPKSDPDDMFATDDIRRGDL